MEELEGALRALAHLLRDEKTLSAYEVHTSRLVPVLLHCLAGCGVGGASAKERVKLFRKVFAESAEDFPPELDTRWVTD